MKGTSNGPSFRELPALFFGRRVLSFDGLRVYGLGVRFRAWFRERSDSISTGKQQASEASLCSETFAPIPFHSSPMLGVHGEQDWLLRPQTITP